jgi:hypothetical protein
MRISWKRGVALAVALVAGFMIYRLLVHGEPILPNMRVPIEPPSEIATWPWPGASIQMLRDGVTIAWARDAGNRTGVTLLTFDTNQNPRLKFEIYDADEDDDTPNDHQVAHGESRTIWWAFHHLQPRGRILAVWNGPFFNYASPFSHTAPTVRQGIVYHNVGSPRWGIGIKDGRFRLLHRPTAAQLTQFDWANGNVQALVVDGHSTRLLPPASTVPGKKSPESQPDDCGPFPFIDYVKTARTSLGWKDGVFAMLTVTQAPGDNENTSNWRRALGLHQTSGWDIRDLQNFWLAWKAEGACNLDGGLSTQVCYATASAPMLRNSNSAVAVDDPAALKGRSIGALLFPYVREDESAE